MILVFEGGGRGGGGGAGMWKVLTGDEFEEALTDLTGELLRLEDPLEPLLDLMKELFLVNTDAIFLLQLIRS